jgi:ABC-type nitrate/sulfonate/bicarbonate transport system ATPase subunit
MVDVTCIYRRGTAQRAALAGVSMEVANGEFVAIIGPNGTGKSTLLRLVSGLLTPDQGSISVAGEPVSGPGPRVGLVFQEPRLLPWRTTLDNVAFPLELAGWTREARRSRATELLRLVGLRDAGHLRPHELSGGMRQRASIARALILEPAVLLLDEPFSALDALTRERFNLQLRALWRKTGATVVLVTHSISEAVLLADRVVVLTGHPGRVAAEVTVDRATGSEIAGPVAGGPGPGGDAAAISAVRAALGSDAPIPATGEDGW